MRLTFYMTPDPDHVQSNSGRQRAWRGRATPEEPPSLPNYCLLVSSHTLLFPHLLHVEL